MTLTFTLTIYLLIILPILTPLKHALLIFYFILKYMTYKKRPHLDSLTMPYTYLQYL